MTIAERIQVLVCHTSPVLAAGLTALLARHEDLDCTAGDGAALMRRRAAMPAVMVADHSGAIELLSTISTMASLHSRPRVLVVTRSDRECDIRAAISAGVQGYLLIDDAPEHLAGAIRAVQDAGAILSPRVATRLADNVASTALTMREQAVLSLVVEGLCNKSIGTRLGITSGTVKSHLRSAFSKLGAASRTQAIAIVQSRGLLQTRTAVAQHDGFERRLPPLAQPGLSQFAVVG